MQLTLENLTHRYPAASRPALDSVSLTVHSGEILALIGGSGSGKSTLLRCIAGLEHPATGKISLGERSLSHPRHVAPELRRIGMVSQSGDLFPHLTLLRNTSFGLRHLPARARHDRALECLHLVGLSHYAHRFPAELSGGEAQRAALARALAYQPDLLLLDEPFSNLDSILREQLRTLTLDLLRSLHITTLFVTHHADDALAAGDRIAVLREGSLIQCDSPRQLWSHPADPGVAALFGSINFLPCSETGRTRCYRADELHLCSGDRHDCLACGTVERVDFLGASQLVILRIPQLESPLRIRISPEIPVQPGATLGVQCRKSP